MRLFFRIFAKEMQSEPMRKVIGLGETVYDIVFKNAQPIAAFPGGSTFNAMISLGRSGVNCMFIGEAGDDRVGRDTVDFLTRNDVDAHNVSVFQDAKSPVSLAFLNERGDADYLFYKNHPNDRLELPTLNIQPDDIVLIGSFYAVNPVIRPQVQTLLDEARANGAIIYYDVNFRRSHQHELMRVTPNLLDNFGYADIVRGSSDDFVNLYKTDDADKIYRSEISFYCKRFICTRGADQVELRAENGLARSYPVPQGEVLSTIGAGDNFNAGFIYEMIRQGVTREQMERGLAVDVWDKLVKGALEFSADSCRHYYNYVSTAFGEGKKVL